MCENPYSGMSVAAPGKVLGRCVFVRVSLALLCVIGGMSAWGWDLGHTIISSRAVQLLGHEDRSLFGGELGAYTNHFSLIPDWVYKNDGTEHYVWDFCGGKTPYDSKAFVAFHILPNTADAYYHLLYAVTNAVNAAKAGRTHDFSCYAGVLSHMLEDWTCPAHSTADDNMMTILSTYLPPPEGMEHVAAKMHGKVESGDFNLDDFNYTPRCIAASAEELSFRLVLLAQNASLSARKDIIPMVRAIYASDKREIGRLQRLSGERAAVILSDALSTIGSLVRGTGAPAEGRDISLLDCRPESCRSLAYPQSQYFGVPYWGHPQVDWCFGGTVKVPLKLNISGRATVVRGYFMGVGKPQTFFIPAGLFKAFKARVGLHSELGRGSKAAFSVYMNGRKRGEVSVGGDDDAVEMSLSIPSDVTNITLQVSKGSPDNKQYCIWGDPTLCLDTLGSDPTSHPLGSDPISRPLGSDPTSRSRRD